MNFTNVWSISDEEDYNGTQIAISVQTGTFSQSFTIDVFDDLFVEGDETFTAQIESVSACGIAIGSNNTIEVIIMDNEGMHVCNICTYSYLL